MNHEKPYIFAPSHFPLWERGTFLCAIIGDYHSTLWLPRIFVWSIVTLCLPLLNMIRNYHVCSLLGYHYCRNVGVSSRDNWHDGCIDHSKSFNPDDSRLTVNYWYRIIPPSHPACPSVVMSWNRVLPCNAFQVLCVRRILHLVLLADSFWVINQLWLQLLLHCPSPHEPLGAANHFDGPIDVLLLSQQIHCYLEIPIRIFRVYPDSASALRSMGWRWLWWREEEMKRKWMMSQHHPLRGRLLTRFSLLYTEHCARNVPCKGKLFWWVIGFLYPTGIGSLIKRANACGV